MGLEQPWLAEVPSWCGVVWLACGQSYIPRTKLYIIIYIHACK